MGADMLICSMGFKAKKRFIFDEAWARAAFKKARRAIEAIDEGEWHEEPLLSEDYDSLDEYKQVLLDDLREVECAVLEPDRQAGIVEGGAGILPLVSGGMSWGDSPTELYDSMSGGLQKQTCVPMPAGLIQRASQNQSRNQ